jgi:hypothetical protein
MKLAGLMDVVESFIIKKQQIYQFPSDFFLDKVVALTTNVAKLIHDRCHIC